MNTSVKEETYKDQLNELDPLIQSKVFMMMSICYLVSFWIAWISAILFVLALFIFFIDVQVAIIATVMMSIVQIMILAGKSFINQKLPQSIIYLATTIFSK